MKSCVNCGFENDSSFCPSCGQKLDVKRVTVKGLFSDLFSKWFGLDNQFSRTVHRLTTHPEVVLKIFLQGNRTRFLGPLAYLVVMTALMLLSFELFGVQVEDFIQSQGESFSEGLRSEDAEVSQRQTEAQIWFSHKMAQNFRLISVSIIPFLAIAMGWFYRREKLNYAERLIIFSYVSSHGLWITILSVATFAITGAGINAFASIITIGYVCYATQRSFSRKPIIAGIGKAFLMYVVGFLIWFIAFMLILWPILIIKFTSQ